AGRRRPLPVDADLYLRILDLQVRGHIAQFWQVTQPRFKPLCSAVELVDVGAGKGELVETLRLASADIDHWRVLHERTDAGDLPRLAAQLAANRVGIEAPLVAVHQTQLKAAGIRSAATRAGADRCLERCHVRVV